MKIKDIIKKQTTIIAIAVILITIAVIGVSYAIFFDVSRNTQDQVITAGNLRVTISATTVNLSDPMTTSDGLTSEPITYTPSNTDSNLPATYYLYIYGVSGNTVDLSYVKVSTNGTSASVLTSLPTITEGTTTYYQIDTGTIASGQTGTSKSLRLWLDEDLVPDEIAGENLKLNLYIVGEVDE